MPSKPARCRVLVVDDEEPIRFALEDYLVAEGHEVRVAGTAAEARNLLSVPCDVLITDLRLGTKESLDGLELLSFAERLQPGLPVFVLSAYGSEQVVIEARRRGAAAFFHKPLPLARLAQEIDELLERTRHEAAPASTRRKIQRGPR